MELRAIKLSSGCDILTYVEELDEWDMRIYYPMKLILDHRTNVMQLVKWMPMSLEVEFILKKNRTFYMHPITDEYTTTFFENAVVRSGWEEEYDHLPIIIVAHYRERTLFHQHMEKVVEQAIEQAKSNTGVTMH